MKLEKKSKRSGIYQIINKTNKKIYVGSSGDLFFRRSYHFNQLKRNVHGNFHLQRAFNLNNFALEFHVIEYVEVEDLLKVEQVYLDILWDGGVRCYNISKFSDSPSRGIKHTKEAKEKIRQANFNRVYKPLSEEAKIKMSQAKLGKKLSKEHKLNIGKGNTGKRYSEETRKKMSESQSGEKNPWFGKKFSQQHKDKIRQKSLGRTHTDDSKKKMNGRKISEETREKMCRAAKLREEKKKQQKRSI